MGTDRGTNRGEQGIPGPQGEVGEAGPHGHDGIQGEQGEQGPSGDSSKIVLLTKAFENVAAAIHQDRSDRKWLALIVAMILALGLFVIIDGRNQAKDNGRMAAIILAVLGCTAEDTPKECAARTRAGGMSEGTRRIIEVDCVTRRAVAGMPAPDPTQSCLPQTPKDVYPGVERPQR